MRRIKVSLSATVFASPNKGQGHFHFVSQSPRWPYKPYFTICAEILELRTGLLLSLAKPVCVIASLRDVSCYVDTHIRSVIT